MVKTKFSFKLVLRAILGGSITYVVGTFLLTYILQLLSFITTITPWTPWLPSLTYHAILSYSIGFILADFINENLINT